MAGGFFVERSCGSSKDVYIRLAEELSDESKPSEEVVSIIADKAMDDVHIMANNCERFSLSGQAMFTWFLHGHDNFDSALGGYVL